MTWWFLFQNVNNYGSSISYNYLKIMWNLLLLTSILRKVNHIITMHISLILVFKIHYFYLLPEIMWYFVLNIKAHGTMSVCHFAGAIIAAASSCLSLAVNLPLSPHLLHQPPYHLVSSLSAHHLQTHNAIYITITTTM